MLNILIHNFPKETVVKDCVAGTKMLISDECDWDWSDKGWKFPDNGIPARDLRACSLIFEPPRDTVYWMSG